MTKTYLCADGFCDILFDSRLAMEKWVLRHYFVHPKLGMKNKQTGNVPLVTIRPSVQIIQLWRSVSNTPCVFCFFVFCLPSTSAGAFIQNSMHPSITILFIHSLKLIYITVTFKHGCFRSLLYKYTLLLLSHLDYYAYGFDLHILCTISPV